VKGVDAAGVQEEVVRIGPGRIVVRIVGRANAQSARHAQKISDPPKQILRAIAGVTLVPLEDADACCGGAGVYWLQQPELSHKISLRKVEAIRRSGAKIVATGNPGCLLQIRSALRAAALDIQVVHPIELLARAYIDP